MSFNLENCRFFFFLLLGGCVCGCNYDSEEFIEIGTISEVGLKEFMVDSTSLPSFIIVQFVEEENSLLSLNFRENLIEIFDYETGKFSGTIKPQDNFKISGFYFHNKDSVFYDIKNFKDEKNYQIRLVNIFGDSIDTFIYRTIEQETSPTFIFPYAHMGWGFVPFIFGKKLYWGGANPGEFEYETGTNRPNGIVVDLSDKHTSYFANYPSVYQKFNWGFTYFRFPSWALNSARNELIMSFPAEEELIIYDISGNETVVGSVPGGSKKFDFPIHPYSKDKSEFADVVQRKKHMYVNSIYFSIYYDRYRRVFYRLMGHPVKDYDPEKFEESEINRKYSIIVLSEELEFLCEEVVDNIYEAGAFVNEAGFHLLSESLDNKGVYKIFRYNPI